MKGVNKVKLTRRTFFRTLLIVFGVVVIALGVFVWVAAGYLVSPPRRALQDYHRDWLEHAGAHGMLVDQYEALDGLVPCILVRPDAAHGAGERGKTLRKQLTDVGWKLDAYGTVCGTLVLLHGREGRKEDLLPVAERFVAAGFRCILPDLPAHGESKVMKTHFGNDLFECNLASEVLQDAATRFDFSPEPAGLWGMSMGGAFAISAAAAQPQQWKAMVLVCTFDTLSGVESDRLHRWFGPFAPLMERAVDFAIRMRAGTSPSTVRSVDKARRVLIPTLVAHGDRDALISIARGRSLYDALPGTEKKWIEVPGGTHETILVTPLALYSEMSAWFLANMHPGAKPTEAGNHL